MQALDARHTSEVASETLAQLEARIERGLQTFVEVGTALLEIRDRRLYREQGYDRFEDYCRERLGFKRAHAYRLMESAEVVNAMSPMGDIPETERQARELAPLRHDPEAMRQAWERANEATGGKPTATAVQDAVHSIVNPETKTEAPASVPHSSPAKAEDEEAVEAPVNGYCSFPVSEPIVGLPATREEPSSRLAVHFSSERMDWATPQLFFERLDKEFNFTLDVCATDHSAKCRRYFTPETDGLSQTWDGVCWMNPPYGTEIADWMRKAYEESRRGATVVCLVPSRTDTNWWHEWAMKAEEIRFVRGRLKFEGAETSAPFPSAVVVLRPGYEASPRITGVRADG